MTYYWNNFIDDQHLLACLSSGCDLVDCINEPNSWGLEASYDDYASRRFKIFQNGFCLGYTAEEVVNRLNLKPLTLDVGGAP